MRELIVDPNRVFFDSNTSAHHHFYDVESGEITDICADRRAHRRPAAVARGQVTAGIDIIVRTRPAI